MTDFECILFLKFYRKVGFKKAKSTVDSLKNAASSEDEDDIDARLESILDDEIDQYNSFKEKSLLEKGKKAKGRGVERRPDESDEEEVIFNLEKNINIFI